MPFSANYPVRLYDRRYYISVGWDFAPQIFQILSGNNFKNVRVDSPTLTQAEFMAFAGLEDDQVLLVARLLGEGGDDENFVIDSWKYIVDEKKFSGELYPLIFEKVSQSASASWRLERETSLVYTSIDALIPGRFAILAHKAPFN